MHLQCRLLFLSHDLYLHRKHLSMQRKKILASLRSIGRSCGLTPAKRVLYVKVKYISNEIIE